MPAGGSPGRQGTVGAPVPKFHVPLVHPVDVLVNVTTSGGQPEVALGVNPAVSAFAVRLESKKAKINRARLGYRRIKFRFEIVN